MLKFAVGAVALAGAHAEEPAAYTDYDFAAYLEEHGKAYTSHKEYEQRKQLFEKSLSQVKAHNEEYKAGHHTWWAAMNHLADHTADEFARLRSAKYSPSQHPVVSLKSINEQAARNPESIDWREKGAVTPVKNQGGCGSCWAFSATESVESHYFIASKKLLELAPQTYVNCVKNPGKCGGTGGCEGATMELAFNLTKDTGIALESDMPYMGQDETCKPYKAAVKVDGYVKNPENSAIGLETALTIGPVSITVAAEPWQMYGGGVFTGCSGSESGSTLDHGVQAVGYSKDYWLVRNSWGAGWGESGYIRISRAADSKTFVDNAPADGVACKPVPKQQIIGGECGILFDTCYPTGVHAATSDIVV